MAAGQPEDSVTRPIRLVLVDDHELVVFALSSALEDVADIEVVGTAGSIAGASAQVRQQQPDVVLLDRRLPDGDGADAVGPLLDQAPDTRVLLYTGAADQTLVDRVVAAGGSGVLLKGCLADQLVDAIRLVAAGRTVFDADVPDGLRSR